MKKIFLAAVTLVGVLTGCGTQSDALQGQVHSDYTQYVNPLMEHSWGQKVIRFYDLDGNLIEVGTPM